jgi:large subunit ribosomal protein L18
VLNLAFDGIAAFASTLNGTPECPRLNVYRSEAEIYAQVIDDQAGHTLAAASSIDHESARSWMARPRPNRLAWSGSWSPSAPRTKGVSQVVFDRGGFRYIGRVKAWPMALARPGWNFKRARTEGLNYDGNDRLSREWNSSTTSA